MEVDNPRVLGIESLSDTTLGMVVVGFKFQYRTPERSSNASRETTEYFSQVSFFTPFDPCLTCIN